MPPAQTVEGSARRAEPEANTCRKDFEPAEALALQEKLLELERPAAKARQREGGSKGGRRSGEARRGEGSGNFPEGSSPEKPTGEAAELAAEATGYSHKTLQKVKAVVEAAKAEPDKYADIEEQAGHD